MMLRSKNMLWILSLTLAAACGAEDETAVVGPEPGAGGTGGAVAAGGAGGTSASEPPPCVENPVTHLELINACTTSVGVVKTSDLRLLNPDGSLPPP
jgi:hypothetical protein